MKRRKLEIEALDVDSFVTGPAGPPIGTIRAHADLDESLIGADVPKAEPKYTEEGYPAFTCTGGTACTLPGVCTCPDSCDPRACTYPPGCVAVA